MFTIKLTTKSDESNESSFVPGSRKHWCKSLPYLHSEWYHDDSCSRTPQRMYPYSGCLSKLYSLRKRDISLDAHLPKIWRTHPKHGYLFKSDTFQRRTVRLCRGMNADSSFTLFCGLTKNQTPMDFFAIYHDFSQFFVTKWQNDTGANLLQIIFARSTILLTELRLSQVLFVATVI